MGNIIKLDNGKFKTSVYDIYGKRHRKTFNRKGEADAFISKIESVKHNKKLVETNLKKKQVLISEAVDNYALTKTDMRPKTRAKYANFVKQIKLFTEALNIKYVDEFTPDHATILFNELIKPKKDPKGSTSRILKPAARTVNFYLRTTRTFFQNEVLKGHIDKNPLIAVKNLRIEKKTPEFYTKEEIQRFFAQDMKLEYRNAFLVLLHTGMRFAELANLTWQDIDLDKRLIHVRPKENFKAKTFNSIRKIPMNEVVFNIFTVLSMNTEKSEYPICSVEGHKLREKLLYDRCQGVGKKANIEGQISLHKFRHTFASHLVQNRAPIEYVQKLLGHASINETMVYAHLRSEDLHSEVKILENLFNMKPA